MALRNSQGAMEMAQQGKEPVAKPENLNSVPGIPMVEGENLLSKGACGHK